MKRAALLIGCLFTQIAAAQCPAPPVKSADHATCLAQQFANRPSPPPWELVYQVKDAKSHWLVYYGPKPDSGVRGGGGDLKIDKKTGEVVLVQGHR